MAHYFSEGKVGQLQKKQFMYRKKRRKIAQSESEIKKKGYQKSLVQPEVGKRPCSEKLPIPRQKYNGTSLSIPYIPQTLNLTTVKPSVTKRLKNGWYVKTSFDVYIYRTIRQHFIS